MPGSLPPARPTLTLTSFPVWGGTGTGPLWDAFQAEGPERRPGRQIWLLFVSAPSKARASVLKGGQPIEGVGVPGSGPKVPLPRKLALASLREMEGPGVWGPPTSGQSCCSDLTQAWDWADKGRKLGPHLFPGTPESFWPPPPSWAPQIPKLKMWLAFWHLSTRLLTTTIIVMAGHSNVGRHRPPGQPETEQRWTTLD